MGNKLLYFIICSDNLFNSNHFLFYYNFLYNIVIATLFDIILLTFVRFVYSLDIVQCFDSAIFSTTIILLHDYLDFAKSF